MEKKTSNKFKNLHRPERARTSGVLFDNPSAKKFKLMSSNDPTPSEIDAYEKHKAKMRELYKNKKWSSSSLSSLLNETYGMYPEYTYIYFTVLLTAIRKHWIITESPSVNDILSEFPCLVEPKYVRQ